MSGCKVGDNGAMQRERWTQQGGNPAPDHGKVAEPGCTQFQCNPAWRGAFRLLRRAGAIGIGRQSQKMRRHGRGGFSG